MLTFQLMGMGLLALFFGALISKRPAVSR